MKDTDRKSYLDAQYRNLSQRKAPAASLVSFLSKEPLKDWLIQKLNEGPWAEVGSGHYSLFEKGDELFFGLSGKKDLYAFDLSSEAISQAPHGQVNYIEADATLDLPHGPFSFILDGHFLHGLSSLPEVFQALGVIGKSLKPGGLFAGEVMMAHKNLSFDHDLYFDHEKNVLYHQERPIRTILEAREWETLFQEANFEIRYFVCQSSIKMIPMRERTVPMSGDPECLRFVLKRPEGGPK